MQTLDCETRDCIPVRANDTAHELTAAAQFGLRGLASHEGPSLLIRRRWAVVHVQLAPALGQCRTRCAEVHLTARRHLGIGVSTTSACYPPRPPLTNCSVCRPRVDAIGLARNRGRVDQMNRALLDPKVPTSRRAVVHVQLLRQA